MTKEADGSAAVVLQPQSPNLQPCSCLAQVLSAWDFLAARNPEDNRALNRKKQKAESSDSVTESPAEVAITAEADIEVGSEPEPQEEQKEERS